jgi:dTDP-glucose 4,6-dehydratase
VGPRGVYDEAKRFAEGMTVAYRRYHGVDTRIVRIFNTYGTRMRASDGRVVSNFIVEALEGEDLTVYGNGNQTRSFSYVTGTIEGIMRLSEAGPSDGIGLPFNIGNSTQHTVRELAERILKLTGSLSEIISKDLPEDDPGVRCPNISRAREHLGWEPRVDIDKGLQLTIDHFRQVLDS